MCKKIRFLSDEKTVILDGSKCIVKNTVTKMMHELTPDTTTKKVVHETYNCLNMMDFLKTFNEEVKRLRVTPETSVYYFYKKKNSHKNNINSGW